MGSSSKSSRWLCVGVRRMGCKLRCRPHHLTVVYNYKIPRQHKQGDLADQGSMFTVCRFAKAVESHLTDPQACSEGYADNHERASAVIENTPHISTSGARTMCLDH
ncbi:uncharacterized protein TNCV_1907611 [Trichonephila clavipes]|nr:uncharacterized protein TNCV_1907611 [Trichonephila clavipes]